VEPNWQIRFRYRWQDHARRRSTKDRPIIQSWLLVFQGLGTFGRKLIERYGCNCWRQLKLLVALWKYVNAGVAIEGAVLAS
jgi:hypothetical protein